MTPEYPGDGYVVTKQWTLKGLKYQLARERFLETITCNVEGDSPTDENQIPAIFCTRGSLSFVRSWPGARSEFHHLSGCFLQTRRDQATVLAHAAGFVTFPRNQRARRSLMVLPTASPGESPLAESKVCVLVVSTSPSTWKIIVELPPMYSGLLATSGRSVTRSPSIS